MSMQQAVLWRLGGGYSYGVYSYGPGTYGPWPMQQAVLRRLGGGGGDQLPVVEGSGHRTERLQRGRRFKKLWPI